VVVRMDNDMCTYCTMNCMASAPVDGYMDLVNRTDVSNSHNMSVVQQVAMFSVFTEYVFKL